MFVDLRNQSDGARCAVLGFGHTELPAEQLYDNQRFIRDWLSPVARAAIISKYGQPGDSPEQAYARAAEAFTQIPGIVTRHIFPGSTHELGTLAAETCLRNAGVSAADLDFIIVGTNTGRGYPSTAACVKGALGARSEAATFDMQEACPVGALSLMVGSALIKARYGQKALVVATERATSLASKDDYESANLFGDEATAWLLASSPTDQQLLFFLAISDPFDGKSEWIFRKEDGRFYQDGHSVHEFVGQAVPEAMADAFKLTGMPPESFQHLVLHQASGKTVGFLVNKRLRRRWPEWMQMVQVHRNVETHGNTSGACSGWLISRGIAEGTIKRGDRVLVVTFGSGMGIVIYGLIVP